jgi:hypothetical protein
MFAFHHIYGHRNLNMQAVGVINNATSHAYR